jgi:hypothetical protein
MNCRQVGPRAYQFIEIIDMHEATGETTGARYCAEVKFIDLAHVPENEIKSALRSCGWEGMPDNDRALAECCVQYGLHAPVWQDGGSNRRDLLRAAYREANLLAKDPNAFERALDRPVNAIGSTAREFMSGDLEAAMERHRTGAPHPSHETPSGAYVRTMKQRDLLKCPFAIFDPTHYREDGTCKCNDPMHRELMKREWGYTDAAFRKAGLI